MIVLLALLGFVAAASWAAVIGHRGLFCDRRLGYVTSARVARDPRLTAEANRLMAFWSTGAALLAGAVLIPLVLAWRRDIQLTIPMLLGLALYGFVLACMGTYPFEKIKRLSDEEPIKPRDLCPEPRDVGGR